MTRKQAIERAISILSKDIENDTLILKLKEIEFETAIPKHWQKSMVLEAFEDFYLENNRIPKIKELSKKNMLPSTSSMKKIFGTTSIQHVYDRYLPQLNASFKREGYSPYYYNTIDDFIFIFKTNYIRIKKENRVRYVSGRMYDMFREKGTPLSITIMKNCECKSYHELLILCGIKNPSDVDAEKAIMDIKRDFSVEHTQELKDFFMDLLGNKFIEQLNQKQNTSNV